MELVMPQVWEIKLMQEQKIDLKFGPEPVTTLAVAEMASRLSATVRYKDEKDISKGDIINIISTETGESIGTAEVKYVEKVPVREALDVITMHWAEYGIQQTEGLISTLNVYYGDPITETTEVKVIIMDPDLDGEEVRP